MRLILAVMVLAVFLAHFPKSVADWELKKELDASWDEHHQFMGEILSQKH